MKKRIRVKASRRSQSHYRMQEVGQSERPKVINHIWEMTCDEFKGMMDLSKLKLKEKYIKEHCYGKYDKQPGLQKLVDLAKKDHNIYYDASILSFSSINRHEQSILRAIRRKIHVPLQILKDYPDIAYAHEIDITDEAVANEPPIGEIEHLYQVSKKEFDSIVESAELAYEDDPNKIKDTMLNEYYSDELIKVKKGEKLKKKVFDNLPEGFRRTYTKDTMNLQLHQSIIRSRKKANLDIPDYIKNEYPMIFSDIPVNFVVTGDPKIDKKVNGVLETLRSDVADGKKICDSIRGIIGSSGEQADTRIGARDKEITLIKSGIEDVFGIINPKLVNKIKESGETVVFSYNPEADRAYFTPSQYKDPTVVLPKKSVNDEKMTYSDTIMSHEYGHAIEYMVPSIFELSKKFLDKRTENENMISMHDISPTYSESEYTKVDNFIDPYIGKIYLHDSTEILSMGMGYMTNAFDQAKLYRDDPAFLGFVVSVLAGKIGLDDD